MTAGRPVVAVVDDDPRLLESLEDLLESAGYAALSYASAEALLANGTAGLAVVVTDIGLAGMSGLELRDALRRVRPGLPVFLITGRHEIAEGERARAEARLFCKPFDAGHLLAAIGEVLGDEGGGE